MSNSKKPRKKYKPKAQMLNPHDYVLNNRKTLSEFDPGYITNIQIRAHSAMDVLIQGKAQVVDMDVLAASYNITLGMTRVINPQGDIRSSFNRILHGGLISIQSLCDRGKKLGRITAKSTEIAALNELIGLHDEVLNVVTVKQFEAGMQIALADVKTTLPKGKYHVVETNFQNA